MPAGSLAGWGLGLNVLNVLNGLSVVHALNQWDIELNSKLTELRSGLRR